MPRSAIRILFVVVALYDLVLGLGFLVAGPRLFEAAEVTPPNHWGYVQFPALLLLVFAAMFFAVARNPVARRELIPYGIGLKVAYTAVVAWHWVAGQIPALYKPFAVFDAITAVVFWMAYRELGRPASA